jgi:hypothetical protein
VLTELVTQQRGVRFDARTKITRVDDQDIATFAVKQVASIFDSKIGQSSASSTQLSDDSDSEHMVEQERLAQTFNKKPWHAFDEEHRRQVQRAFPQYQFFLLGENGAGKSTTLYWMAFHAKIHASTRNMFNMATGSGSHTQALSSAAFGDGVVMFDTKGLTDWDTNHLEHLGKLLSGHHRVGCPMEWRKEETTMSAWLEQNDLLSPAKYVMTLLAIIMTFVACHVYGEAPAIFKRAFQFVALVFVLREAMLLFYTYNSCGGYKGTLPVPHAVYQNSVPHAVLFIIRYPSIEGQSVSPAALYKALDAEAQFFSELKKQRPLLEPVLAVTHLSACTKKGAGHTAQECASQVAKAVGMAEFDNVFPLEDMWKSECADSLSGKDKSVHLLPGQLVPIIQRLQDKAHAYYRRTLQL